MCVPCKIVLDEDNRNAAGISDTVAKILIRKDIAGEDDDLLYELACREVDHIEAVRSCAVKMAESLDAPDRWVNLMRRWAGQPQRATPGGPAEED